MAETINIQEMDLETAVDSIITRFRAVHWGKKAGLQNGEAEEKVITFLDALNVNSYTIKWITSGELSETISRLTFEGSELWDQLKEIPERFSTRIRQAGQEELLFELGDRLPEIIFHQAFSHMIDLATDKKSTEYLIGLAMYLCVLTCSAELAGEGSSFYPMIELLEMGNLVLGVEGNTIYLL
ncbi:MAG TPA: hypothetical protein VNS08_04680 [Ureibacillus sp.]|nr:hypothetical protein [Ureibacillus sp.]